MMQRCKHLMMMLVIMVNAIGRVFCASAAESFIPRLEKRVTQWREELPALREAAQIAAKGVLAGGNLYVTGTQPSFGAEAGGRSGGLMFLTSYHPEVELTERDTILAAMTGAEDEQTLASLQEAISRAEAAGARVVLFAGAARDRLRKSSASLRILPRKPFDEDEALSNLSIESVSNVIALWAWTGEFVTACVEQGKMPCMYESYGMPGGCERADVLRAKGEPRFHEVTNVTPESAAGLGERYLEAVGNALAMTWERNQEAFDHAAMLIRQAHEGGHVAYVFHVGHMFPTEFQVLQNPEWFRSVGPEDKPKPEDVAIMIEYQGFPWRQTDDIAKVGSPCIVTCSHLPPAEFTQNPRNVYINPCWEIYDAGVILNGYDVRMLPISGVMQSAIYWQLVEKASKD